MACENQRLGGKKGIKLCIWKEHQLDLKTILMTQYSNSDQIDVFNADSRRVERALLFNIHYIYLCLGRGS